LDDLDGKYREEISSTAFLVVQTSRHSFQVWLAIPGAEPGFASRLVKGIGADSSASRAGRLAGTPNCKSKYAPDFPAVRIFLAEPGDSPGASSWRGFSRRLRRGPRGNPDHIPAVAAGRITSGFCAELPGRRTAGRIAPAPIISGAN
jgi:hypothetical protein